MSYNVITFQTFDKQVKRLIKKYPSLKDDILLLGKSLAENPKQGVALGMNFFKVRLAISSKGKGKSGGARVITHIYFSENTVVLVNIYDKSEQDSVSDSALKDLLKLMYL